MLPGLYAIGVDKGGLEQWMWQHSNDHFETIQKLKAVKSLNATLYVLEPFNKNEVKDWLLRHQQAHNEMNTSLGLGSQDLQTVNFDDPHQLFDWLQLNYNDHQNWHQILQF